MKKVTILLFALLFPLTSFAEVTTMWSETDSMVGQLKAIIDQYGNRIKALETENTILRNEIMKAGIKIPLSAYSGMVTIATPSVLSWATTVSSSGVIVNSWVAIPDGMLSQIEKQYSFQYAGFIRKIHNDWMAIKSAYKMPSNAFIWGYEFVKQGKDNHVFVDIVYTWSTASGIYDAKILYEYHTGTFQRKLVGFFEFNKATGYYLTRTGNNPFAWVQRIFVSDPSLVGTMMAPVTASGGASLTQVISSSSTSSVLPIPTIADIEKAYGDKRYLTVISLSNTYLQSNPTTADLLRIRYRTFFIIGKYNESLSEIGKIESLGKLDKAVACDAQVIATYSKSQDLIDRYTKICKG